MSTTPVDPETRIETAPPEERAVWEVLREVEDPELPVSVVDLGLVYGVEVDDGDVRVALTLTYSGCPARDLIVADAEAAVRDLPGVDSVAVDVVYAPPWTYDRITDRGREQLADHGVAVPGDPQRPDPNCHE